MSKGLKKILLPLTGLVLTDEVNRLNGMQCDSEGLQSIIHQVITDQPKVVHLELQLNQLVRFPLQTLQLIWTG